MIYLIITTSIYNKVGVNDFEHRKNRYIDCIESVLDFIKNDECIKPIIVENNGNRNTYLDDLNCDVVYTNNNELTFDQKAMNELLDIKEVIHKYDIKDDDFIIKLTGRYKMTDPVFFNTVKENCHTYDAFVKFYNVSALMYMNDDCVLGLFAIKCKYLKTFTYVFQKSPECEFAEFVRTNTKNIIEIRDLYLECCFAGDLSILHV